MRYRAFRVFGFVLASCALLAFLLHPNHLGVGAHSDDSHCCVCHTVPMGAASPQTVEKPVAYLVFNVSAPAETQLFVTLLTSESPRGPPCA